MPPGNGLAITQPQSLPERAIRERICARDGAQSVQQTFFCEFFVLQDLGLAAMSMVEASASVRAV